MFHTNGSEKIQLPLNVEWINYKFYQLFDWCRILPNVQPLHPKWLCMKANTLHMLNFTKLMPPNVNDDCELKTSFVAQCACSSTGNEFQFYTTHTILLQVHSLPSKYCALDSVKSSTSEWWRSREKTKHWSAFDETRKLNLIKFGTLWYASLHGINHHHSATKINHVCKLQKKNNWLYCSMLYT